MQNQRWVSAGANLVASRAGGNQLQKVALDFFKNLFISGLDKNAEYEADAIGVILAARAGYNAFGLAEVLHKLGARGTSDPSVVDLFGSHPIPSDRLAKLGDLLTPRMDKMPVGIEPEITPVSASAAAPARGAAPAAVSGARALSNEGGAANTLAPAPAQKPAAGGLDPGSLLKGLFGR
jgi:predicted Zn-dependent protease